MAYSDVDCLESNENVVTMEPLLPYVILIYVVGAVASQQMLNCCATICLLLEGRSGFIQTTAIVGRFVKKKVSVII